MIDLSNQVALVTGGSRGIGASTAIMLARAGADVALLYLKNKRSADGVVKKIRSLGCKSQSYKADLRNYSECKNVIRDVLKCFDRIDILVNNGGIWEFGEVSSMTPGRWRKTVDINLNGTFNICRQVVPIMKKQRYGRIINVSSTAGQRGEAFHSHYAASKGGIISFTKSIAVELIRNNIWVNCVAPGWVDTDMISKVMKDKRKNREILRTIPRGKVATSDEIAGPILFLCSSLSDHIVGEVLNINGGSVLCG